MERVEIAAYLGAAAASDGPMDGRERDLLHHLLQDFGAEAAEARRLVAGLGDRREPPPLPPLHDRDTALRLLRALLVISYCDGCFDSEEVPFLTPVVDRFSLTGDELNRAKQQALLFLKLSPPSVRIPASLTEAQQWEAVSQFAHRQFQMLRQEFFKRFHEDMKTADEETCLLAIAVGPPSFDTSYTRERFVQAHPDYLHMEEEEALRALRDEAERQLRAQWDAAYVDRCGFCYLDAPGKRRDPCPRCSTEYGEAPRRP